MEELQRKKASRKAYRSHLTRLLRKVDAILDSETRSTETQIATLTSSIEQLTERGTLLRELDGQIATTIQTESELEAEIIEAEATQEAIRDKISQIRRKIDSHASSVSRPMSVSASEFVPSDPSPRREPPVSRLPKLNLPSFAGDPLTWQSFWDSFKAAVHSNAALDCVQKFNYLKAQLHGDASRAIAGLLLTSANYDHAVTLLQERFGQSHKIVSAHMQALLDIPKPVNSLSSLRLFYDSVESHIRGLAALGKSEDSYGALLVPIIFGRLPAKTRSNLARSHTSLEWSLSELKDSILTEIRVLESGFSNEPSKKTLNFADDSPTMTTASFYTGASNNVPRQPPQSRPRSCTYCQSTTHSTSSCDVVSDRGKRLEIVRRESLCFNCLGRHRAAQCRSKSRCKQCKGKHHTSICETTSEKDKQSKQDAPPPSDTQKESTTTLTVSTPTEQPSTDLPTAGTGCLLKTAVAEVRSGSHRCRAQILFDEGAQRSFMTQQLAHDLNIQPYKRQRICVSAFGGEAVPKELQLTSVAIQTKDGGEVPVSALVVPKIAAPLQNLVPTPGDKYPYLQGLPLAHPVGNDNFEISLLIGADFYWKIVQDKIVRGNGPTAMESKIGYLLSGPLSPPHTALDGVDVLHVGVEGMEGTNIAQFWNVEFTGTLPTTTSTNTDDQRFLTAYLNSSVHQNPDGSYIVGFPWKNDHPPLPSNRGICERRTRSLARKLAQTPELLKTYGDIIVDQVKRGFIERVRECDVPYNCHFIPHHAVKKQSVTTPVRIVYDCSCRQSPCYPSLNDCLQVGPPFLIDLCTLLLRFRSHKFALVTDIEKAFLHVQLAERDRSYTHFLWLSEPDNPESQFAIYRFRVVLFGSASSPFMLHAALKYHLTTEKSTTASDILANLYVDNVVSGCSSETRALEYYKEARCLMSKANFNLRSWASNSSSLMALAQQDRVADNDTVVNVLGLLWDTSQDTLGLSIKLFPSLETMQPTKRAVLQDLSKIFDPLGVLTPVTISAKLFMQQLWQHKLNWNEPLTSELTAQWRDIAANLQHTTNYVIPRLYLQFNSSDQLALHVFVDASMKAYGAVTYLCHKNQSSLIMAKARVAPVKRHTLPRLELMAACIGARLCNFVLMSLNHLHFRVVMWSDSQITLHWLSSKKKLQPFVANRVYEIHELLPDVPWQYCPTQDNPADLVTRGISLDYLTDSRLWKHGPSWLSTESQWPKWEHSEILHLQTTVDISEDLPNRDEASLYHTGIGQIIDIQHYSNLPKLLRVSAYILRFVRNCKQHTSGVKHTDQLQPAELDQAVQVWICYTQQTSFPNEFSALQSKAKKYRHPPLVRQLQLFLNNQHIICCGGRIHNAMIDKETKFPCLLPKKHPLTALIVYYVHKAHHHAGVNATVTAIRQNYWIPSARQIVKSLLRRCVTCRRIVGRAYSRPDPPPLPSVRTRDAKPFEVTGVDFTRGLHVKRAGDNKVYVCLFTCDVVIIHDTPRINWKLAVVERLITGLDGITRAAEIRTAGGKTNRPITRLFPLEINENSDQAPDTSSTDTENKVTSPTLCQGSRPTRKAAIAACGKLKEWTDMLRVAPEDVKDL